MTRISTLNDLVKAVMITVTIIIVYVVSFDFFS
jgi:hypothetical protein